MTFRVGQKVVCIKRQHWDCVDPALSFGCTLPAYGDVFTIATIEFDIGHYWLAFREIPERRCGFDQVVDTFNALCFRPLAERKTSIEIFKKLLHPSPAYSKDLCGND